MKNKIFFLILLLSFQPLLAENLKIQSTNISIDKKAKLTIFKDNVRATDNKKNSFLTEYAEYEKDPERNDGYSDQEISAICQKFLDQNTHHFVPRLFHIQHIL